MCLADWWPWPPQQYGAVGGEAAGQGRGSTADHESEWILADSWLRWVSLSHVSLSRSSIAVTQKDAAESVT